MSAQRPARPPHPIRSWLTGHKQRLAYLLVVVSMAVVVGAATAGGFLLHRSADIQRQTLRTQALGGVAFQLQTVLARAQTEHAVTKGIAADRTRALRAAAAAFQLVRTHDPAAGDRVRRAYVAYVRDWIQAADRAAADSGRVPVSQQRQVERRLTHLENRIDAEIERQAQATRVTNPEARLALVIAALAAALLVGVLIWQFDMQRRAGRIDRDHARRSEDLMRLRADFVAAISHELRTPLTSILGYLELIADDESSDLTPDGQAYLAVVQRNAERLLRLVSDLLLVAAVEHRTLALDFDEVDLRQLATQCVEAAKPSADAKRVLLTLSNGSPGLIEGDPIRLAQMMDNLVSNAIKFTPAGGNVMVRTAARDSYVVFEVVDSGTGISPEDRAQLFDPFFRAEAAVAHATQGTGLGLTITKAIVDAHGGSIDVESTVGVGTTFEVELPRRQLPTERPAAPAPSVTAGA